jgi:hypothetical protein
MKRLFIILLILFAVASMQAKVYKSVRPSLIEIGPKGSLYISSVRFGIGAEVLFNPMPTFGIRVDATEVSFGNGTVFYLNHGGSLDALIYIPMRGMQPYVHTGFGFSVISNGGSATLFSIRAGLGLNYPMARNAKLFIEPGIIIYGNGGTDVMFRLSMGGRFGLLR